MARGDKTKLLWQDPTYRARMTEAQQLVPRSGEDNPFWKGDKVGYHGIHIWIRKQLGKPLFCEHCKTSDTTKKYQWANRSGQYKRDVADWMRLCLSCHKKFDLVEKATNRIIGRGSDIKLNGAWHVG